MEKVIYSKYAKINIKESKIELLEKEPSTCFNTFTLEDVSIFFEENNIIRVKGLKIEWGFTFDTVPVKYLNDKPRKDYIILIHYGFLDFIKGIKTPCVKPGWYKL